MTERTWDKQLDARGVKLTPAVVRQGQSHFKLTQGWYLGEWGGRHGVFVDVLDEKGNRMVGLPVRFWWKDGFQVKLTEAKPGDSWSIDFPMHEPGWSYGIAVDGISDSVFGMGLGTIENPQHKDHVSYKFIFQRTNADAVAPEPDERARLIAQMVDSLQRAHELLQRSLAAQEAALALLNRMRER